MEYRARERYLNADDILSARGINVLAVDGRLPHPGDEAIGETYYNGRSSRWLDVSLHYKLVGNPGYNRDRGPANVFAIRLHPHA